MILVVSHCWGFGCRVYIRGCGFLRLGVLHRRDHCRPHSAQCSSEPLRCRHIFDIAHLGNREVQLTREILFRLWRSWASFQSESMQHSPMKVDCLLQHYSTRTDRILNGRQSIAENVAQHSLGRLLWRCSPCSSCVSRGASPSATEVVPRKCGGMRDITFPPLMQLQQQPPKSHRRHSAHRISAMPNIRSHDSAVFE